MRRQYDQALIESERAIALNPNDPDNYANQGATLVWSGQPEGAIHVLETALRYDPMMGARPLTHLGVAYYLTGRYDDAVTVLERAVGMNPNFAYGQTILAATYGMRGDSAQAFSVADTVRRVDPFFRTENFGHLFRNPAHSELLIEGLRKAGLD
jgi:tetratricopeptide (TPR) repeat protein